MSVIDKAIAEVRRKIPRQVLEVAFLGDIGRANRYGQGIEWYIRNRVIDNWVRPDCDLLGAYEDNIPLLNAEITNDNRYRMTARISKEATGGRSIIQALYMNYMYNVPGALTNNGWQMNSFNMTQSGNSPMMNTAGRILRSATPAPLVGSAQVQLVAENTILITDYIGDIRQCAITCRLSHDPEMNNIQPGAVKAFTKLVVFAAKAWIYNETVIDMDENYLYQGMELGRIREIIDGYADAAELYDDYFKEEWGAISYMNDHTRNANYIRSLVSGKS